MNQYYEAVEICPHCSKENIFPMYDVEENEYVVKCKHCDAEILLCDECLHSDDNTARMCDWCKTEQGGKCFRGCTID